MEQDIPEEKRDFVSILRKMGSPFMAVGSFKQRSVQNYLT